LVVAAFDVFEPDAGFKKDELLTISPYGSHTIFKRSRTPEADPSKKTLACCDITCH
jgi:hypothetical protein